MAKRLLVLLGILVASRARAQSVAPGVLVTPGPTVYLMAPGGGIDALDGQTGKLVWHSSEADRPLHLRGGSLLAQLGDALVVLDARDGKLAARCSSKGPRLVLPPIDDGMGEEGQVTIQQVGRRLLLSWSLRHTSITGTEIPGGSPGSTVDAGAATIELGGAGCVTTRAKLPVASTPAAWPDSKGTIGPGRQRGPDVAELGAGRRARVVRDARDGRLLLERQRAGKAEPTIGLPRNACNQSTFWTADQAVFGVWSYQSPGYALCLYDSWTGRSLVQLGVGFAPDTAVVMGDLVFMANEQSGRQLEVWRLTDGQQAWSAPYRDTSYHGGYPPGAAR